MAVEKLVPAAAREARAMVWSILRWLEAGSSPSTQQSSIKKRCARSVATMV
jgi:hypothetical protein